MVESTSLAISAQTAADAELRRVLRKYLSSITVISILDSIYQQEGLSASTLSGKDLERVFQSSLFLSVRMFCPGERLSEAMLDLAELMERMPGRR